MLVFSHDGCQTLGFDLSEYPQEVADYVGDQLEDRLHSDSIMQLLEETEIDRKDKRIDVGSVICNLMWKILEEKLADIEYERKHGERG